MSPPYSRGTPLRDSFAVREISQRRTMHDDLRLSVRADAQDGIEVRDVEFISLPSRVPKSQYDPSAPSPPVMSIPEVIMSASGPGRLRVRRTFP